VTLRCLPGFRVALSLPFADTQTRFRAANGRIGSIGLTIDRARFRRVGFAIRHVVAIARNARQKGRFLSVNRRVVGSNPT
jgi:hypothetical protein